MATNPASKFLGFFAPVGVLLVVEYMVCSQLLESLAFLSR
jgi:hypothetical protein